MDYYCPPMETTTTLKKKLPCLRTSSQIRCKYLKELGIVPSSSPQKWYQALRYEEEEDDDDDDDYSRSKNLNSVRRHPLQQPERRIRFNNVVTVRSIASYRDYSPEIRNTLWTPTDETMERRKRSTIEFRYDGWDWRTASEEEDMYIDRSTGDFIHPAHVVLPGSYNNKAWGVCQLPKYYEEDPYKTKQPSPIKRDRKKTRKSRRRNPMDNYQYQQQCGLSLTRFADT